MAERLKYSPLIEALCEFRFVPTSDSWDWTIPGRLYDEIGKDFSDLAQVDGLSVQLVPGSDKTSAQPFIKGPERVQMKRRDGSSMVQVGPHLLVVNHLKPYSDWESFRPMILDAFAKHEKVTGPAKVARIGLRYINQIRLADVDCPMTEITTLDPHRQGALNRPLVGFYQRFVLKQEQPPSALILQVGTQQVDPDGLLMLDLDIGSLPNHVFTTIDSISSWLNNAHDRIDEAFLAAVNPSLIERWKRGER